MSTFRRPAPTPDADADSAEIARAAEQRRQMVVVPTGVTGRLAAWSVSRPWLVIGLWGALVLLALGITLGFPARLTSDANFTNEPETIRAQRLIASGMPRTGPSGNQELLVVQHDGLTVDDAAFADEVSALQEALAEIDGVSADSSWWTTGDESWVAQDRRGTLLPVLISRASAEEPYLHLLEEWDGRDGFAVSSGGGVTVNHAFVETSERDLLTGEVIGISVAMLVLVLVFGTLVATSIPLVLAVVAILIAMGMVAAFSHVTELSIFVLNMLIMIGLAVGIDYSLFIVGRYREERFRGLPVAAAVVRTGDTAAKAVLFSGLTVVIALLGMVLVPSTIFRSLGVGAIFVVLVAVAATLTLLPAALALLGNRIERGRGRALLATLSVVLLLFAGVFDLLDVPSLFSAVYVALALGCFILVALRIDPFARRRAGNANQFWLRQARVVMRNALPLAVVTTLVLAGLGLVYFTIRLGESGITTLPHDTSAWRTFDALERSFPDIALEDPHQIVVVADDVTAPAVQAALLQLQEAQGNDPAFGEPQVEVNPQRTLTVVTVPAIGDVHGNDSIAAIQRLRDETIPAAFAGSGAEALVTGPTAYTIDFNETVETWTPIVFGSVLIVSFFLLLLAFRSIVVPLKSVLLNVLSVGAAYGVLVIVCQHGIGNDVLGMQQVERIDAWVPLLMFSILFGLSMDYHVFLLSRIREHWDLTHDNAASVGHGLMTTGSMISGAALIMVAVFGGFAMGELVMFQQIGLGLAVAVLLDATIVRSVMVPSMMQLLGARNWYFPRWLEWLPRVNVEGVPEAVTTPGDTPGPSDTASTRTTG